MIPPCLLGVGELEITNTTDLPPGKMVAVIKIQFSVCIYIHSSVEIDLTQSAEAEVSLKVVQMKLHYDQVKRQSTQFIHLLGRCDRKQHGQCVHVFSEQF